MDLSRLSIVVLALVVLPQLILGQEPVSDATRSICQAMIPSPTLEMFVDALPKLNRIHVSNGSQLTLGAYKIQQVLLNSYTDQSTLYTLSNS